MNTTEVSIWCTGAVWSKHLLNIHQRRNNEQKGCDKGMDGSIGSILSQYSLAGVILVQYLTNLDSACLNSIQESFTIMVTPMGGTYRLKESLCLSH